MNGVAAQSMRQKGIGYKLNWGVSIVDLRTMAAEYGKDYDLAIELWKEDIRECKLLATMIMPPERMLPQVVDIWMEQTHEQETVEMAVLNLYQYLPYAEQKAFQWLASENSLYQIAAYLLLARLFMQGQKPDNRRTDELIDNAAVTLESDALTVKHAAVTCLMRLSQLGTDCEERVKKILKTHNIDI